MVGYVCDNCGKKTPLEYSVTGNMKSHMQCPSGGWYFLTNATSYNILLCTRECLATWVLRLVEGDR